MNVAKQVVDHTCSTTHNIASNVLCLIAVSPSSLITLSSTVLKLPTPALAFSLVLTFCRMILDVSWPSWQSLFHIFDSSSGFTFCCVSCLRVLRNCLCVVLGNQIWFAYSVQKPISSGTDVMVESRDSSDRPPPPDGSDV